MMAGGSESLVSGEQIVTLMLSSAACLWLATVAADPSAKEDDTIVRWNALYEARAKAIVAEEDREEALPFELHPKSILRYTNPQRPAAQHGSVHVWTDKGVPRVIGAIWSAEDRDNREQRNLSYEFHSLSAAPLKVTMTNTDVRWEPRASGVEWITLKDVPVPPATRPLRLTAMRRIAAEWTATGLATEEAELRLLPQPLYRYPETVSGPLDGAIFAFVVGTDPELFVVLEASKERPGISDGWRISPARLTGTPLTLKRKDETLWSSPTWENFNRQQVYDFLYGIERLTDADLDESVE
jgi:hypothetical protein